MVANGVSIRALPEELVVFDPSKGDCRVDAPDAPAVGIRRSDGDLLVISSSYRNFPIVGPQLSNLRPTCKSAFEADGSDDPEKLDDRTWIHALFSDDGSTVFALGSAGYMPYRHGKTCPVGEGRTACWYNGLVLAKSIDGGKSFAYLQSPPQHILVAAKYDPALKLRNPPGFITATNVVPMDGWAYTLVRRRPAVGPSGICVFRMRFQKPVVEYLLDDKFVQLGDGPDRDGTNCRHVGEDRPMGARGLVYHAKSRRWIAVFEWQSKSMQPGMYYRVSTNLIDWEAPKLLLGLSVRKSGEGPQMWFAYPSIIDEASPDRMLSIVGDQPKLVAVKIEKILGANQEIQTRRSIVAYPLEITAR